MGLISGTPRLRRGTLGTGIVGGSGQWGPGAGELVPRRTPLQPGAPLVNSDTALRHSAVWACIRLRNDLISTLPVAVFRRVNLGTRPIQLDSPLPPLLLMPT